MTDPSLPELETRRAGLYERLAAIGDFRRGSISENYRRCGKPNCACARPDHPGHGPRFLWTRTVAGRGTRGRQLSAAPIAVTESAPVSTAATANASTTGSRCRIPHLRRGSGTSRRHSSRLW